MAPKTFGKTPRYWEEGHLTFSGSSVLGVYNFGAALVFKKFAPHIAGRKTFTASSGVFTGLMLATNAPPTAGFELFLKPLVALRGHPLRSFRPGVWVSEMVRRDLDAFLPEDAHLQVSGKMFISVTRTLTFRPHIISQFDSLEHLKEVITAAWFIPILVGYKPPTIRGTMFMDGGFTNNLHRCDENTITVSVFTGDADIKPPSYMPNTILSIDNVIRIIWTMFPPSPEWLIGLLEQGYRDALVFVREHDLYACSSCAQLPHRPQRGECAPCQALLEESFDCRVDPEFVRLLKAAQKLEDARDGTPERRLYNDLASYVVISVLLLSTLALITKLVCAVVSFVF